MALPPDELRKRIPQWSLESDGQLLQYMVQISKNLIEKCTQTQENLDRLLLEADESHINFANASNNFNALQQEKFVENQVKDDDENFYSVREEPEDETTEKLSHNEIFQMAVEKSIDNMYKCFEKVTVQLESDSDSEDDDEEAAARNTILRAVQKYPYINRPLPHVIGSKEWREKWHAGLIDSEEESDTDVKEQYSDSSDSDGMFLSQTNSNHTPSESEGSVWGVHSDQRRRAPSIDPSMSGDDTLSIHSTSSAARPAGKRALINHSKVPVLPVTSFKPPSLFPDQPPEDSQSISSKSRVPNLFEESDEDESTPTHKPVAQISNVPPPYFRGNQPERKTVNLFADEPPPPSQSAGENNQNKKSLNLFIESDEENDSFNNNTGSLRPSSLYKNEPPPLSKKAVNLFDDDEPPQEVTPTNVPASNKMSSGRGSVVDQMNNNQNLDNEEDDLFVPVKRSINGGTGSQGVRRITNLFDDEPPVDDFDEIFKPKTTKPKIPGAKLVLPSLPNDSVNIKTTTQKHDSKKLNLFDSEDEDVERLKPTSVSETQPSNDRVQFNNPEPAVLNKIPKLFDDEDDLDSDIFSTKVKLSAKPKVNLFDEDDDVAVPPPSEAVVNNNNNVSNKSNELPSKANTYKNEEIIAKTDDSKSTSIRSEILKKKSIFDSTSEEDDEDFLFNSKKNVSSKTDEMARNETAATSVAKDHTSLAKEHGKELIKEQAIEHIGGNSRPVAPSEPPEDSLWVDNPTEKVDHEHPVVSNDIDYFLTTNRISSGSDVLPQTEEHISKEMNYQKTEDLTPEPGQKLRNSDLASDSKDNQLSRSGIDVPSSSTSAEESSRTNSIEHDTAENSADSSNQLDSAKIHTAETKSALQFNSIGLFDDIPPPDDDFEENRASLAVDHTDDGFFSGRPSSKNDTVSSTNRYLFLDDDGPPPDDLPPADTRTLARDQVDDLSKSSKEPAFKSISTIIEERNRNESTYGSTKEKPKISKLSAKVNINVNALLPGARRPQILVENAESKPAPQQATASAASAESVPENKADSEHSSSTTNRLTGLNKGRARIPVKRKPSSRQNRRANYRNSLDDNTEPDGGFISESPSEQQAVEDEERVVVGSEVKIPHVEVTASHLTVQQLLSNELSQKLEQPKLFEDNEGVEKVFADESNSISSLLPKSSYIPANESSPIKPTTVRKTISSSKLFSDDETGDDDLFGTVSKPATNPGTSQSKASFSNPAQHKITVAPPSLPAKSAQSIFDDSDDDDDLFSNVKPISKPTTTKSQPEPAKKSIFGSDEESDGDDIFGGVGKKSTANDAIGTSAVVTREHPAKPIVVGSTKSIFGDDDDDDDLFGSLAKSVPKHTSAQKSTERKTENNRSTKPGGGTSGNDPLADLLEQ